MEVKDEKPSDLVSSIKFFFKETFNIIDDTDVNATIDDIKAGVPIKGQTAWVLIFSILIASAGLITSSSAVVIGAMLISPLMGPIIGIGVGLAIYDTAMVRHGLKNFLVACILAIIVSGLYFFITPLHGVTSEIL